MTMEGWRRRLTVFAVLAAAAVAALAGGQAGAAAGSEVTAAVPGECPPVLPVSEVRRGMTGTGWTVSSGRDPEPFSVEVLGVLRDAVAPGRDLIITNVSSPAISRAGGVWFGMSGSPVYIGDRLVGAVAHGLAGGPSTIAGLTPAEDMLRILSYPMAPPPAASGALGAPPVKVPLPPGVVQEIASSTGTPADDVGRSVVPLRVPLSVSGVSARGMRKLGAFIRRERLPLVPFAGASASRAAVAPRGARPVPGGNFAAAASYGDLTLSGVGTTTYVCKDRALAFGHPLDLKGKTAMGANDADALGVVPDPLFGPFKVATVAERYGRVDQDRFAGLRALLDAELPATAVRSSVVARDTGQARRGGTDVVMPDLVPFVASLHVLSNIDTTFDAIGPGSSRVRWTIAGTRAGGAPWRLARANMYASRWDIAIESSDPLWMELDALAANPFEKVRFTAVRASASVEETPRRYTISKVLVAKNAGPYRAVRRVRARPGMRLRLRVVLKAFEGRGRTVRLRFVVPRRARLGGMIDIHGGAMGGGPPVCFSSEECEGGGTVKSFDHLLRILRRQPRNNHLLADFRVGPRERVVARRRVALDQVVQGWRGIFVALPGGGESESEEGEGEAVLLGPSPEP